MITKTEYESALIIVREYELQQQEIYNKTRVTVAEFRDKVSRLKKGDENFMPVVTVRLVNALTSYMTPSRWEKEPICEYIDEVDKNKLLRQRNSGKKVGEYFDRIKHIL